MHNVMKNILRFIFILFLIFLSLPIFSRSYAFRGLSVTEGLSDLVVNAIYKDSLAYIIHSGFISGYQNRYGDNLKPPTNVYHRMTA